MFKNIKKSKNFPLQSLKYMTKIWKITNEHTDKWMNEHKNRFNIVMWNNTHRKTADIYKKGFEQDWWRSPRRARKPYCSEIVVSVKVVFNCVQHTFSRNSKATDVRETSLLDDAFPFLYKITMLLWLFILYLTII